MKKKSQQWSNNPEPSSPAGFSFDVCYLDRLFHAFLPRLFFPISPMSSLVIYIHFFFFSLFLALPRSVLPGMSILVYPLTCITFPSYGMSLTTLLIQFIFSIYRLSHIHILHSHGSKVVFLMLKHAI